MNCLLQGMELDDIFQDDILFQCISLFPKRSLQLSQLQYTQLQSISKTIQHYLLCGLCKKQVKESVYFTCSHRFCRLCIQTRRVIEEEKNGCPTCADTQERNHCFHFQQWMDQFIARGVNYNGTILKRQDDQNYSLNKTIKRLKLNNGKSYQIKEQDIPQSSNLINKKNTELQSTDTNQDHVKEQTIEFAGQEKSKQIQIVKIQPTTILSKQNNNSDATYRQTSLQSITQNQSLVKTQTLSYTATDNISSFSKEQSVIPKLEQEYPNIINKNIPIKKQQQFFHYSNHKCEQSINIDGLRYFKLKLTKHPIDVLTPQLDIQQILVNSNQCFDTLYIFIANLFNINKKHVQLYYANDNTIIRVNRNGMKQIKIKSILKTPLPLGNAKKEKDQFRSAITQFYTENLKQSQKFIDRKAAAIIFYKIRVSKISLE